MREITLALQECGRRLAQSLRARARLESEAKRRSLFERYIPELGVSIGKITGRPREDIEKLFLKALPNFVNMNEPVPEGPPPEGGAAGGAAAAESPPSAYEAGDGEDERPRKKGAKGAGQEKAKRAAGKNKIAAAKGEAGKAAAGKVAASKVAAGKATVDKSADVRGAGPAKAGKRGSPKAGPGKKGEQLKLIE